MDGITYPWKALRLLRNTPRLWTYIAAPIFVTVLIGLGLYGWAFLPLWTRVQDATQTLSDPLLKTIAQFPAWLQGLELLIQGLVGVFQFLSAIVLFWLFGIVLTQLSVLLAAPWYGQLAEVLQVERMGKGVPQGSTEGGFWADFSRAIQFELKKIGLTTIVGGLIFGLQWIPLIGQIFGTTIAFIWGAILACLDFWDAPLERKRLSFRAKLGWIFKQFPHNLTFGWLCNGLVSIPVLNLLTIPLCVAAGTLFVCDRLLQQQLRSSGNAAGFK